MYTHPTSFHDQNTQIKASSNSVTKFIHPKTWITLMTRIPRCPVQSFFSGCIKFLEFFVRKIRNLCFVKVMTWSMKKMWRPSLRKKKFNPNDRNTSFQLNNQNAYKLTDLFFFQLPPIETITSQPINPNHQRSDAGLRILPRFGDDHHDHFGEVTGALAVWPA